MALPGANDGAEYPVETAEDIVLAKLEWFRAGGEVSERQWRDIAAIIAGNPTLDAAYLQWWAARLNVSDLLQRALLARD